MPVHPRHSGLERKPVKCIQKNKKPAYAYVDPVTLRPLQQHPGAQAPHDSRAQAHFPENRIFGTREYSKEELTPGNVRDGTSLALLQTRARSVRANYKRHWERLRNLKPDKFKWESPVGDGDVSQREAALKGYISSHFMLIEEYARQIRLSPAATRRWSQAIRSGRPVIRHE